MKSAKGKGRWAWPIVGAVLCLGLGTASGLSAAGGDGSWYRELVRPIGTPPSWVFGPVWTILYLLMGVALGRLVDRKSYQTVTVFGMQFVLNLLWTPVFFGMQRIDAALAVICAMGCGLVATIVMAWKVDRVAAWLLVPYLIWLGYATYLNAGFFILWR